MGRELRQSLTLGERKIWKPGCLLKSSLAVLRCLREAEHPLEASVVTQNLDTPSLLQFPLVGLNL